MTLFEEYYREREEAYTMKSEDFFLIYKILKDQIFIVDFFISKNKRGTSLARKIINDLEKIAIENKCNYLTGVIRGNDKGASHTMLAALSLDFKIVSMNNGFCEIAKGVEWET